MPVLQAYNIHYKFDNGTELFQQLSCSMVQDRVGLVGRNGAGKSILASILCGEHEPSGGAVKLPQSFLMFRQQPSNLLVDELSIAQYLEKDEVLEAIHQVELGHCSEHWFDIIGEQWDLRANLEQQLKTHRLPVDTNFPCAQLSGGQLARLQLWQMFESDAELLILDEPSNHLDIEAKQWLIASMQAFKGAILLISHDRELLREMDEIWELSGFGLQVFSGNYDVYKKQKQQEIQAVKRQLSNVEKQSKKLALQAQRDKEKAEQRAAQGNKLRRAGSHGKSLLDTKKENATARVSNRNKNVQLRQTFVNDKKRSLSARIDEVKEQKLYLTGSPSRLGKVLSIVGGVLPLGRKEPVSLQVEANEKVHLTGNNGSGKSTLLKALLGEFSLTQGEMSVNTPVHYLDQYFGSVEPSLSILDNLLQQCPDVKESDARTLLAGIGFRGDSVFRFGRELSGGEKMKLAMIIVSHQPEKPLLLLDEPDNHLDLESKIVLAKALSNYSSGFILISHDHEFAAESGVQREVTL